MENSALSNCVRRIVSSNQQRTIQYSQEESSWTMYFDTEDGLGHYDEPSMISDAASPISCLEEDTATSPSNRTKGYTEILEDNTLEEKTKKNTKNEEKGLNMKGIMSEEYCAELKKRGLCLVPLSMLSNYIG